jgi:two-component system NtrC family sensor kinase
MPERSLSADTPPHRLSENGAEARLLAAIAHELKGPLQALSNLLYLIANDARSADLATNAREELERIKRVTSSLLEASREGSSETEVDLAAIFEKSLESFQQKIEFKRVEVAKRIECRGVIKSAPIEIRHVFDNVIVNALEAVPIGGRITIHLIESPDWRDLGCRGCRFTIFDNGPGIAIGDSAKIFEPFFTTKKEKGTGIGLWVAQRIVKKYGGSIRVRSALHEAKHGTAFSIFLPANAAERGTPGSPADKNPRSGMAE